MTFIAPFLSKCWDLHQYVAMATQTPLWVWLQCILGVCRCWAVWCILSGCGPLNRLQEPVVASDCHGNEPTNHHPSTAAMWLRATCTLCMRLAQGIPGEFRWTGEHAALTHIYSRREHYAHNIIRITVHAEQFYWRFCPIHAQWSLYFKTCQKNVVLNWTCWSGFKNTTWKNIVFILQIWVVQCRWWLVLKLDRICKSGVSNRRDRSIHVSSIPTSR